MLKHKKKSSRNVDTLQELVLMRHSIRTIRDRVNEDLDAMVEQINRLIPSEDGAQARRFKNFTKKDWKKFLTF